MRVMWLVMALAPAGLALGGRALGGTESVQLPPAEEAPGGSWDVRTNAREVGGRALAARGSSARRAGVLATGRAQGVVAAVSRWQEQVPGLEVVVSGLTGAPELIHNTRGPLTDPAPGVDAVLIARDFLRRHRDAFGLDEADLLTLHLLGASPGGGSGLQMVRLEQRVDGVPVFQSETRFLIDRNQQLWRVLGSLIPGVVDATPTLSVDDLLAPTEALANLLEGSGMPVRVEDIEVVAGRATGSYQLHGPLPIAGPVSARLVLFPLAPGVLVPAWSLVVFSSGAEDWYAVVDAETGDVLWRKNIREAASTHDAQFRVFVQADGITPADSPAPASPNAAVPGGSTQFPGIVPSVVSMHAAQDLVASPNGWIDDCPGGGCTAQQTQTLGNNVLACLDRVGGGDADVCDTDSVSQLDGNGRPTGNPDGAGRNRNFHGASPRAFDTNFLPPPQAANPEAGQSATGDGNGSSTGAVDVFRRGVVSQLFYVANWYHDRLSSLGFDEAAGNFQLTNFSGMGLGADRVLTDAQDSAGTSFANFSTPPDGVSGRAQFGRFTGPTVDRDSALDAEIVVHELTHGLTGRLIGNAAGLLWDPGRAMGEGWSDFYALALLNPTQGDDPTGRYPFSAYSSYKLSGLTDNYVYGFRRFPYTTNNTVNPLTWADIDDVTLDDAGSIPASPANLSNLGGMEVHNAGTVWALTLWEVRARVIADPAGAAGDVATGNETMLQLVTDAIKMTPSTPSFEAGREALLAADCATNACANEAAIWEGFADRGFGYGGRAPLAIVGGRFVSGRSHLGITESFVVPHLDVVEGEADVEVDDSEFGNGDGRLDPGETVTLRVTLTNPWRGAGKAATGVAATLSSATGALTLVDTAALYPDIAPQGSAANLSDAFVVRLSTTASCGQSVWLELETTSSLGSGSASLLLRVGTRGGVGSAITYAATPNLAIPDAVGAGVSTDVMVADDLEIADLDFRVTELRHAKTGDVTVLLRAPSGYGADLIWRRGLATGQFTGADFVATVIDDDLAVVASEDLMLTLTAAAPFTGDWLPAYNGPSWDTLPVNPPVSRDPVGHLGRLDGSSTLGTWSVNVADVVAGNSGPGLVSWALLVKPRLFACTVFTGLPFADGFESGNTAAWLLGP